ncbi:MAG: SAM-dependent methyltransferase [Lentisphaerota bacterium]
MTGKAIDFEKYKEITYESFRERACNDSLSLHEKVGFPDEYREGREPYIFQDILGKLSRLNLRHQTVVDLGPGCSGLARMMVDHCRRFGHQLIQVDSPEMLALLPDEPFILKTPGRFPQDCAPLIRAYEGKVDVVLAYSIIPCVFAEQNIFGFIDELLGLLNEGGELLLGDIPNASKRKRFFGSSAGVRFHQTFMGTEEKPSVEFNVIDHGRMDDAVLLAILSRCRAAGYDAFLMPQQADLPLSNRREDILIIRP